MKKTRLVPKIAAMMIVAIMVCVMVASAYQGYASTLYGNDHNYYAYGTYYVDSATRVRAGTWVRTTDYATVQLSSMLTLAKCFIELRRS